VSVAPLTSPSSARAAHRVAAVRAFTRLGAAPRATFPLVLASVTVATLAMHADRVVSYSPAAFGVGLVATVGLAFVVAQAVHAARSPRARLFASLGLPALGGAAVGVFVQLMVLVAIREDSPGFEVRDLGGLVDSSDPALWLAAGVVLGAAPAAIVSAFLVLAARALRRLVGSDAHEAFAVAFTGASGIVAAFGLLVVHAEEMAPLVLVVMLSCVAVLACFLVDGARLAFLRHVFRAGTRDGAVDGGDAAYEIAPAEHFRSDASLAPIVAQASAASVLVRIERHLGSYRAASGEPIALLAETEEETTRPLRRRRLAALALLATTTLLSAVALGPLAAGDPPRLVRPCPADITQALP